MKTSEKWINLWKESGTVDFKDFYRDLVRLHLNTSQSKPCKQSAALEKFNQFKVKWNDLIAEQIDSNQKTMVSSAVDQDINQQVVENLATFKQLNLSNFDNKLKNYTDLDTLQEPIHVETPNNTEIVNLTNCVENGLGSGFEL